MVIKKDSPHSANTSVIDYRTLIGENQILCLLSSRFSFVIYSDD